MKQQQNLAHMISNSCNFIQSGGIAKLLLTKNKVSTVSVYFVLLYDMWMGFFSVQDKTRLFLPFLVLFSHFRTYPALFSPLRTGGLYGRCRGPV